MDITTHNRLEFTLKIGDNSYSLKVPNGVAATEAMEACGFFLACLEKLKKEKEEALEAEQSQKPDEETVSLVEENI